MKKIKVKFKEKGKKYSKEHRYDIKEIELCDFKKSWIEVEADNEFLKFTESLGEYLATGISDKETISTSQLRNIYGEIMRIKLKGFDNSKTDFKLIKPKVAYNYGRINNNEQKKRFKEFLVVFNQAHDLVKDKKNFENFHKFFEAILAYHKYYGGK